MNFITPIYFILTVFVIGVILFYLFRKQYDKQVIPSTLLWQQVMQEWQATKWWKKLQNHLLLYLQLLILIILMLALTRPYFGLNELSGDHIVVILDTSATMTTLEEEKISRFERSKLEIEELIDLLDSQMMTVILAEETPTILFANETAKQDMLRKIDSVEPSYQFSDIPKAVQLAEQLLADTSGEIHLYSDGVVKEEMPSEFLEHRLTVHNIGKTRNNISLHTFGISKTEDGIHGIITVFNEQETESVVRLGIESDGETLHTFQKLIEPGKLVQLPIPNLPDKSYYKAVIMNDDDYLADNSLIAFTKEDRAPSIHLVGDVNPFTTKALGYFSTDIVQYEKNTSIEDNNAVYVLEDIPEKDWPNGPALVFSPVVEKKLQVQEKTFLNEPLQINQEDPLYQYVDMEQVYIQSSFPYTFPVLDTILSSGNRPLISKGYYNGNPIVFVGFDMEDTDWPLHASFPIFLYNAINFLNEKQDTLGYVKPLETFSVTHEVVASNSMIVNEDGKKIAELDLDKASIQAPSSPGLYRVVDEVNGNRTEKLLAVTLDTQEKYIQPEKDFTLEASNVNTRENNEDKPNEIWPWLVFLALLILFLEWEVYRRGITH
ncbi:vWA domain-containing protein [Ornithinibacillus scapharcae]|uniref:vWA domain-containing protein n=1 Tax=Ornithinibacillus scapharcae TaxID=1147159 RepID=UPI000225B344|nr:VWA domain-containing protein [Ornithinibacillus scapharcae]